MNMNFSEKSNKGLRLLTRTENTAERSKMSAGDEIPSDNLPLKSNLGL